jgi:phage gp37-like protein
MTDFRSVYGLLTSQWQHIVTAQWLVAQRREQQVEAAKLDAAIAANLKELGYGG